MKKLNLVFSVLFFSLANAQSPLPLKTTMTDKMEANGNPLIIPYEKYKLPNGLTVIVSEDHSDPIVHVQVTYHVGSARESLGKSGFAHFFEHMMFEGSEHVKSKEHFKIISEAGGQMNGYTRRDATTYFETLPSNQLEVALWLESDRMGFLLDSLSEEKFENQRATVKNEKSEHIENQPYAIAYVEYISQILYPESHPYSWPVIGYVDDLNRVVLQDLKNFFMRWYGPNNAILTITGDVNSKDVIPMVEKYFGNINASPEVKKLKAPIPILATDQYFSYNDNIGLPLTLMAFPTVPNYHRDEPALVLLADMMGGGNNSVFYKNFIKTEKAAQAGVSHPSSSIFGGNPQTGELAGELQIEVFAYPGDDPLAAGKNNNEIEKLIHSTIDEFETSGITEDALIRAKAKKESELVDEMTSVQGKATLLDNWEILIGKPYNFSNEVDRFNKVTKEDIARVFAKYVKGKSAAIVNVNIKNPESTDSVKSVNPNSGIKAGNEPEYAGLKYVKAKDSFDRKIKPAASAPKVAGVPQYYNNQLKNGLKIIGTQNTESPKVVMLIDIRGGRSIFNADPKKGDIANMTAAMMEEGTQKFTTEQISAELDKLGSDIRFFADKDNTTVVIECETKNLEATLVLLEEKLFHPRFAADDFKRVKKQLAEEQSQQKRVAEIAGNKMYESLIYGNNFMGAYSSFKSMSNVTLDDVKNYYSQFYSPSVSSLIIVGDVKESEVVNKFAFLEKWAPKEVKIPVITSFPAGEPTQIYLVHKERAAQSVIMMGHLGMPYDATGNYFKANVMNFPLGGSFSSRINLNLREDKGWTYGAHSYFSGSKIPGTFTISTSVRTNTTDSALKEISKEVAGYLKTGITPQEVEYTKSSLLNSDALKFETPYQKAGFLSRIMEYNLPKDYIQQQAQILKGITKSDIDKASADFIHPEKMVIVVVGNKYLIKKQLENLGMGKVKEVTLD